MLEWLSCQLASGTTGSEVAIRTLAVCAQPRCAFTSFTWSTTDLIEVPADHGVDGWVGLGRNPASNSEAGGENRGGKVEFEMEGGGMANVAIARQTNIG